MKAIYISFMMAVCSQSFAVYTNNHHLATRLVHDDISNLHLKNNCHLVYHLVQSTPTTICWLSFFLCSHVSFSYFFHETAHHCLFLYSLSQYFYLFGHLSGSFNKVLITTMLPQQHNQSDIAKMTETHISMRMTISFVIFCYLCPQPPSHHKSTIAQAFRSIVFHCKMYACMHVC
jgi:hypothetical protein